MRRGQYVKSSLLHFAELRSIPVPPQEASTRGRESHLRPPRGAQGQDDSSLLCLFSSSSWSYPQAERLRQWQTAFRPDLRTDRAVTMPFHVSSICPAHSRPRQEGTGTPGPLLRLGNRGSPQIPRPERSNAGTQVRLWTPCPGRLRSPKFFPEFSFTPAVNTSPPSVPLELLKETRIVDAFVAHASASWSPRASPPRGGQGFGQFLHFSVSDFCSPSFRVCYLCS